MDVAEAIEKRRSVRRYKPDPIPEDVLSKLLNLMRLAPSGANRQALKFIVIRDKQTREQVVAACSSPRASGGRHVPAWIAEAPVIIVACGNELDAAAVYYDEDGELHLTTGRAMMEEQAGKSGEVTALHWDLAIALDHLTLAAVEQGLGTCWVGTIHQPKLKELLSIPDDVTAELLMTIGYPVSWPEPRQRKPLEDIVCYDRYN